jgi:geranylgeranyl pyrophosphate synthase
MESDRKKISDNATEELISGKTASLFEISIVIGYMITRIKNKESMKASENNDSGEIIPSEGDHQLDDVREAARQFGFAFQIADDIDDVEQDSKSSGGRQKNYVLRYGIKAAKERLEKIYMRCTDVFRGAGIMSDFVGDYLSKMCLDSSGGLISTN